MVSVDTTSPELLSQLEAMLDLPEIAGLIRYIEEEIRWTGRRGYGVRAMVGMCFIRSLYRRRGWGQTARLVARDVGLQRVLGCAPSQWACYRFEELLRTHGGPNLGM